MRVSGQYNVTTATSFDNPYLPDHFFDSLRSMSKRRYQQEVEGKVLRPTHSVWSLDPHHLIDWRWQDHPELQRVYGIDWGTQDHHVVIMFQVEDDGRWIAADELICDGIPRGQFQVKLHRWVESHGSAPPALLAVDRACPVENQLLQAKFRKSQVRWMQSKNEQKVSAGIELVRDMLDPLDGDPDLVFSDTLAQQVTGVTAGVLPAVRGYCYHLDATGQPTTRPKKDNLTDHACDALRYAVAAGAHDTRLHGGRALGVPRVAPTQAHGIGRSGAQIT